MKHCETQNETTCTHGNNLGRKIQNTKQQWILLHSLHQRSHEKIKCNFWVYLGHWSLCVWFKVFFSLRGKIPVYMCISGGMSRYLSLQHSDLSVNTSSSSAGFYSLIHRKKSLIEEKWSVKNLVWWESLRVWEQPKCADYGIQLKQSWILRKHFTNKSFRGAQTWV